MVGFMTAASSLGSMILSPIIANIIQTSGYRRAFLVEGIILLVSISVAGFLLLRDAPSACGLKALGEPLNPEEKQTASTVSAAEIPGMALSDAKKTVFFYLIIVLSFFIAFMNQSVVSQQSALITDKGFDAADAAMIISIYSFAAMINKIIFGWINDKFGIKWSALYCALGFSAACILLITGQSYPTMIAYAVLVGLFSAVTASFPLLANTHLFGRREIGAIQGFSQSVLSIGAMVAPIAMGSVFTITGSYTPIIIFMAVLAVAFAILTFVIMSDKNSYANRVARK